MAENKEYRKIKKLYGEKFAKLCRELFPQILEEEGMLTKILEENFAKNSRNLLGEDIIKSDLVVEFKQIVYEEYDKVRKDKNEKEDNEEERMPYEILEKAGYNLYECQTEEDIQSFRKYYAPNEVLCTIYNKGRLKRKILFLGSERRCR